MINEIKLHLSNDKNNKMLMTNYSFFSSILEEKLHSPSRWYIFDGTDYPLEGNKYFQNYQKHINYKRIYPDMYEYLYYQHHNLEKYICFRNLN